MLWLKTFAGALAVLGALASLGIIVLLAPQWESQPYRTALRTGVCGLGFAACLATFVALTS